MKPGVYVDSLITRCVFKIQGAVMKSLLLASSVLVGGSMATGTPTLVWSDALNQAVRWEPDAKLRNETFRLAHAQNRCSGYMAYRAVLREQTIHFEAEKLPGQQEDLWAIPTFSLQPVESLSGAERIRFELRFLPVAKSEAVSGALLLRGGNQRESVHPFAVKTDGSFHPVAITLDEKEDYSQYDQIAMKFVTAAPKMTWELRKMEIVGTAEAAPSPPMPIDVILAVRASAPGALFQKSEPLEFTFVIPEKADYAIKDIDGNVVQTGVANPGKHTLAPLPLGYYFLSLKSPGRTFVKERNFAVTYDRIQLPEGKESNYGIMSAVTDLGGPLSNRINNPMFPGPKYDILVEVLYRANFFTSREGTNWDEDVPYKNRASLENAKDFAALGMRETHVIVPIGRPYEDLRDVYKQAGTIASDFKGTLQYVEFINEPQAFTRLPAWNLAAINKAASLGFKDVDPTLGVQSSSFFPNRPYPAIAMKSHLAHYIDVFNAHVYSGIDSYDAMVGSIRTILRDSGIPERAIHVTECGTYSEGEATEVSYGENVKVQSLKQEIDKVEFYVKSQIVFQSLGVALVHPFVLPYQHEHSGLKDWGLMRHDNTVKPGLVALATLNGTLAAAEYLGTYDPMPGVRGFLYKQPDGSQTLAFWRRTDCDTPDVEKGQYDAIQEASIPQKDGTYLFRNPFGTPAPKKAVDGKLTLPVSKFVGYAEGLRGLTPETPSPGRGTVGATPGDFDHDVVIDVIAEDGFRLEKQPVFAIATNDYGKIKLNVYNFSEVEKQGELRIQSAGEVQAPKDVIVLPPHGKVSLSLSIPLRREGIKRLSDIEATGTFNGRKVTSAVVPLLNFEAPVARGVALAGAASAENWRGNASRPMTIQDDPSENAVLFRCQLVSPVNNFIYPIYPFRDGESLRGGSGIEFEIKVDKFSAQMGYQDPQVHFVAGRGMINPLYEPPRTEEWKTIRVFFDGVVPNPEEVKALRIGFNHRNFEQPVEYKVRNLKVLFDE
ncbi:MAG: hypothetical protein ACOX9C_01975 [Kiritimatiellia bacterium]|jgi:hypothetical protein